MQVKAIGDYLVYEDGTVVSAKFVKPRQLKPRKHSHGYYKVCLTIDGKQQDWLLHRLIATLFIPNTENKPFIDHIDGNKANNSVSNLRWVDAKENRNNPNTINNFNGHYRSKCNYVYSKEINGKIYYDKNYLKRRHEKWQ